MRVRGRGVIILLVGMLSSAQELGAQDQFGGAVAVVGGQALVAKPTVGRGPATLYVLSPAGAELQRLPMPRSAQNGEGISPGWSAEGGRILIGAGDPQTALAGYLFGTDGAGRWGLEATLPLRESVPSRVDASTLQFADILRIVEPPSRVVSLNGARAVAAVVGGVGDGGGVRVLERAADGKWEIAATIPAPAGADVRFGSALVLLSDRVWIGGPGYGGSGAVFRYDRDADGTWALAQTVTAPDLPSGSRLGEALAADESLLLAGAPGADGSRGSVLVLQHQGAEPAWQEIQRLQGGTARDGFGFALALDGREVWVGAPGRDDRRGAVLRWIRTEAGLTEGGQVPLPGADPGFLAGTAVAVAGELGVVGAPGADGEQGRAALLVRTGGGWSAPRWVGPGGGLESSQNGEVTCTQGAAAGFRCDNVDLLSFLSLRDIGAAPGERVSDLWGWTDPQTGREYALVGRTAGAAIVDITQAEHPRFLGLVPANPSGARDLKVYRDHLFFTGDGAGEHGLVIFDLTRLRGLDGGEPVEMQADTVYHGIDSAHNLVIDTGSGFAFPVGASGGGETCGGGLHMVDIRTPKAPVFAGCFTDSEGLIWQGRTHDAQCVVYSGPDEAHRGREICFASNETAIRIVDVTDKAAPSPIGVATYPGRAYVHQGWLSEDQRYFYMNDELDELVGTTARTRTYVWDVSELDDPVLINTVDGPDGSTDHNLYVKGDRMYQANYQAGFRVFDLADPEKPVEIGWFDTTPYEGNPPGFIGAWTAYPFFESGTVIVSSMHEGLFLLRPRGRRLIP